jgi:cap1 methyltransferase
MWELFYNFSFFKYLSIEENHVFSHLAEGPGGFMEATHNYKLKFTNKKVEDTFYSITLKPTNSFIPDFNKIKKIFQDNDNMNVMYGNLYLLDDVKKYIEQFDEKKATLVTADGGFDYSSNFNGQEMNSCQIIYSECIVALNILKEKGCFVCKVFDLFTVTMNQLLYIMSQCFETIHIYKPETSRPANSEKYLVCLYYRNNLNHEIKNRLLEIIGEWNEINQSLDEKECICFDKITIDNNSIQKMNECNFNYMNTQMFYLNNTIELAEKKIEKEKYFQIIENQVTNALKWCKKYDMNINKNSVYLKNRNDF